MNSSCRFQVAGSKSEGEILPASPETEPGTRNLEPETWNSWDFRRAPRRFAIGVMRVYQAVLGPWLGGRCRFYPSCSNYAIEALREHGCARGGWLAVKRVCKCHPLHPGGVDLVPAPAGGKE